MNDEYYIVKRKDSCETIMPTPEDGTVLSGLEGWLAILNWLSTSGNTQSQYCTVQQTVQPITRVQVPYNLNGKHWVNLTRSHNYDTKSSVERKKICTVPTEAMNVHNNKTSG